MEVGEELCNDPVPSFPTFSFVFSGFFPCGLFLQCGSPRDSDCPICLVLIYSGFKRKVGKWGKLARFFQSEGWDAAQSLKIPRVPVADVAVKEFSNVVKDAVNSVAALAAISVSPSQILLANQHAVAVPTAVGQSMTMRRKLEEGNIRKRGGHVVEESCQTGGNPQCF